MAFQTLSPEQKLEQENFMDSINYKGKEKVFVDWFHERFSVKFNGAQNMCKKLLLVSTWEAIQKDSLAKVLEARASVERDCENSSILPSFEHSEKIKMFKYWEDHLMVITSVIRQYKGDVERVTAGRARDPSKAIREPVEYRQQVYEVRNEAVRKYVEEVHAQRYAATAQATSEHEPMSQDQFDWMEDFDMDDDTDSDEKNPSSAEQAMDVDET
ncbi:hypothetical protein TKK_0003334 [Trichogramma kaykai]